MSIADAPVGPCRPPPSPSPAYAVRDRRRVLDDATEPARPVASERLSHAGKVFTSDLSINEFALLHGAGFEPIELVMGVSVYHVGYQFTGIRQQSELPVLTDATYRARWNAMSRHAGRGRFAGRGRSGRRPARLASSGRGRAPRVHRGRNRGAIHREAGRVIDAPTGRRSPATCPARI